MLSTLRTRLNKARRLHPQLCLKGIHGSVYGMRSATDPATNYQVRITPSRSISITSNKERIAHSIYTCTCERVGSPDMHTCEGSTKAVCYHSLASVRKMAQDAGKKVVFCRDMKNALLKREIYKGALIEVKSGTKSVYGVAY